VLIDTPARWRPGPSSAPAGPAAPDAVILDGVSVRFPDQLAVDDISLAVPAGAILGLIGPSGAGKTTTIRLLTGALDPTDGSVSVLGEEPRLVQYARVGTRTGDVVGREPPVEVDGRGQLRQGLGGTVGETTAPEPYVTAVAAHLRCSSPLHSPTCMIMQSSA